MTVSMCHPSSPEEVIVERWVPVPGFARYEVSSLGRIRKVGEQEVKKLTRRPNGRLVTQLRDDRPRTLAVDKLVALAFLGPRPLAHVVAHKDGNPENNAVDNLGYRTRRLNFELIERVPSLSLPGGGKLLEPQACEIKRRVLAGEPGIALAREFGVTPAAVSQIKHGRKWRRLT